MSDDTLTSENVNDYTTARPNITIDFLNNGKILVYEKVSDELVRSHYVKFQYIYKKVGRTSCRAGILAAVFVWDDKKSTYSANIGWSLVNPIDKFNVKQGVTMAIYRAMRSALDYAMPYRVFKAALLFASTVMVDCTKKTLCIRKSVGANTDVSPFPEYVNIAGVVDTDPGNVWSLYRPYNTVDFVRIGAFSCNETYKQCTDLKFVIKFLGKGIDIRKSLVCYPTDASIDEEIITRMFDDIAYECAAISSDDGSFPSQLFI